MLQSNFGTENLAHKKLDLRLKIMILICYKSCWFKFNMKNKVYY